MRVVRKLGEVVSEQNVTVPVYRVIDDPRFDDSGCLLARNPGEEFNPNTIEALGAFRSIGESTKKWVYSIQYLHAIDIIHAIQLVLAGTNFAYVSYPETYSPTLTSRWYPARPTSTSPSPSRSPAPDTCPWAAPTSLAAPQTSTTRPTKSCMDLTHFLW